MDIYSLIGYFAFIILICCCFLTQFPKILKLITNIINKRNWYFNDDEKYYREIPFNNDLDIIYYLGKQIGYIKNHTYIPAFLTQMISDNKITYVLENNKFTLNFNNFSYYKDNDSINEFFDFIAICFQDNTVTDNKLSLYFEKNYKKIKAIEENICNRAIKKLYNMNLIKYDSFLTNFKPTKELKKKTNEIKGLAKFIKDFSQLKERRINEVKIWDEYMIMAALLGIKDAFDNDIKLLYTGLKIEKFYEIIKILKD